MRNLQLGITKRQKEWKHRKKRKKEKKKERISVYFRLERDTMSYF